MAQARPRSNITKTDMEASRLVFVFVQNAKPKRKVAVPVPDGYTWGDFIQQVKAKLKIIGVKEIYLAASGQKVTSLDELQDIDELCVVEGAEPVQGNGIPAGVMSSEAALRAGAASTSEIHPTEGRAQLLTPDRHKLVVASDTTTSARDTDDEGKYARRTHPLKRMLQRLLPSLFAPALPVTTKDTASGSGGGVARDRDGAEITQLGKRRKAGRRGGFSVRALLLVLAVASCLLTMLWFLFSRGPGADLPQP
uniref:Uncharacterized protein n=1 Tax=Chlamydomonas leiostraca TaxID=1034604 RepID=A0A7S0RDR4_9CHLO|mmetsp:Transcript_20301/g.51410  ORF Transcript_20301/g.51410 Transcript_20301/m.51410 type:complete len:252 (+) Transcript_20301:44-799(+)